MLEPGGSHSVFCSWTSAVEGLHTIKAIVDDENATSESDEGNNERTERILVGETCGDVYEPNEGWWNAKQITSGIYGQPLYAVICPAGDEDVYVLNVIGGTVVQADVDAGPLGSNLDSDLYFYDNNRAGRHGGGLAGSREITLISNVIAGNTCALVDANGQGAGLWLGRGELVNNSGGDGSGIRVGVDVTLTNTILYGNTVGVNAYAGSVVDMDGTLWYANGQDTTGDGTIHLGPVNVYQDPLFVDVGAGDFHLGAGSPAIDAGVAAPVAREDAGGNPRPDCIAWDIGAYEAQSGGTSCMRVYLPAVLKGVGP